MILKSIKTGSYELLVHETLCFMGKSASIYCEFDPRSPMNLDFSFLDDEDDKTQRITSRSDPSSVTIHITFWNYRPLGSPVRNVQPMEIGMYKGRKIMLNVEFRLWKDVDPIMNVWIYVEAEQ